MVSMSWLNQDTKTNCGLKKIEDYFSLMWRSRRGRVAPQFQRHLGPFSLDALSSLIHGFHHVSQNGWSHFHLHVHSQPIGKGKERRGEGMSLSLKDMSWEWPTWWLLTSYWSDLSHMAMPGCQGSWEMHTGKSCAQMKILVNRKGKWLRPKTSFRSYNLPSKKQYSLQQGRREKQKEV